MRVIQILCLILCFGSASVALAAKGVKQCAKYATACKAESSIQQMPGKTAQQQQAKLAAIQSCIVEKATADGSTGAACVKEQAGHKKH